ncbi:MAG: hypothetical protein JNM38_20855 [Acidobacteria bacterium]|nr:hypothetical protein [Acidobacteriota bacterium]
MSTRVVSLLIAFAWTIATADAQPVGHQPAEQAAVLAAFDRYLEAVSANDLRAMASMQTPDGMT